MNKDLDKLRYDLDFDNTAFYAIIAWASVNVFTFVRDPGAMKAAFIAASVLILGASYTIKKRNTDKYNELLNKIMMQVKSEVLKPGDNSKVFDNVYKIVRQNPGLIDAMRKMTRKQKLLKRNLRQDNGMVVSVIIQSMQKNH